MKGKRYPEEQLVGIIREAATSDPEQSGLPAPFLLFCAPPASE
jgi:hypothetical protein